MPKATSISITESHSAPAPETIGQSLLALLHNTIRAHYAAEKDCRAVTQNDRLDAAWTAMRSTSATLAFVPIESDVEALAQAVLMNDNLAVVLGHFVDQEETVPPFVSDALAALRARQVLLAKWIEDEFGIDRKDYGLDFFGEDTLGRARFLPQLA